MALLMTFVFFGLFLLYLHSGWFSIDLNTPLYPLRRDSHGQNIQRKSLIAAVTIGILLYTFAGSWISGHLALSIGIITYFIVQFAFFIKTSMEAHISNQ
jgi:hypothetical protein